MYIVVYHVVLDLQRGDGIEHVLDAHIAKFLDNYADADRLSIVSVTSSMIIAPIAIFMKEKPITSGNIPNAVKRKVKKLKDI